MCSRMGGSHLHYRHEATKFPCIFAGNREMRGGDGFADDCLHRQLVPYFSENAAIRNCHDSSAG